MLSAMPCDARAARYCGQFMRKCSTVFGTLHAEQIFLKGPSDPMLCETLVCPVLNLERILWSRCFFGSSQRDISFLIFRRKGVRILCQLTAQELLKDEEIHRLISCPGTFLV